VDQGKGYDWSVMTIQGPIQQRLTFAAPRLSQPHENDSDSLASRAASHRKDPKFEGGWVGDSIASTVIQLFNFCRPVPYLPTDIHTPYNSHTTQS